MALTGKTGISRHPLTSYIPLPHLQDVSGAFRPNVLTALIGETGAGKTTLMDVLAGRKTGGSIEGNIKVQVRHVLSTPSITLHQMIA